MNTNISHTATNTRIEFGAKPLSSKSTTRVDEIGVSTPNLIVTRRHFKDPTSSARTSTFAAPTTSKRRSWSLTQLAPTQW
jgi:hypothetical protein